MDQPAARLHGPAAPREHARNTPPGGPPGQCREHGGGTALHPAPPARAGPWPGSEGLWGARSWWRRGKGAGRVLALRRLCQGTAHSTTVTPATQQVPQKEGTAGDSGGQARPQQL